jgi:hypothetical protein
VTPVSFHLATLACPAKELADDDAERHEEDDSEHAPILGHAQQEAPITLAST